MIDKLTIKTDVTPQEIAEKVNELIGWINDFQGRLDDVRRDREALKKARGAEPSPDDFDGTAGDKCKEHERLFCAECQETAEESSSIQYPDFKKWDKDAIDTPVKGLKVAPEDFYIEFGGKRKDYFTWGEALKYEAEVLKPNGWRLPTCAEWYMLVATVGIGEDGWDDVEAFLNALKMERRGFVSEDKMNDYNYNSGGVANVGSNGYFWSSTSASAPNAHSLYFGSYYLAPQSSHYKGYGFTVRCVAQQELARNMEDFLLRISRCASLSIHQKEVRKKWLKN